MKPTRTISISSLSLLITVSLLICSLRFAVGQDMSSPLLAKKVVFQEENGLVAVESEYFYQQSQNDVRQWYRTSRDEWPKKGRDEDGPHCKNAGNNAYLEILPDTRVTHADKLIRGDNFSNEAGKMAILHYQIHFKNPGRYYVWARAFSAGGEDNGLHVGIDGTWPASGQRLQWCEGKHAWRWESKQRTEAVHCGEAHLIYLDIEKAGLHDIQFSMREDGFEFDRFLLTNEKSYVPEGIGPEARLRSGKLPAPFPVVEKDPVGDISFLHAIEKSVKGVKLLRATGFPAKGTDYYVDKEWLAINPNQHKQASTTMELRGMEGAYDLVFLGVGENDGGSTYTLLLNGAEIGTYQSPLSQHSFEQGVKYMRLFENVAIQKDDKLTVTAKIGSKDGQEWSRGRWGGVATITAGKGKDILSAMTGTSTAENVGQGTAKPAPPSSTKQANISGELKKWHKVSLTFDGPEVSETDEVSPFMHYRFKVTFAHAASGKEYQVPGYFAADGNAGETSASKGNKWRVHFAPDETGSWTYQVDFRKGKWLAIRDRINGGESAEFMDGATGTFEISKSDKTGLDLRAKGRLQYDGTRYLKFAETGEYFLKVGSDAPENLLSYADFDGTFHSDGHKDNLVKTWEPHLQHWKSGDPTWQGGKGKALIGAVNYLAGKGMNVYSFLTNNIAGDDQNVFPYIDYDSWDRFDCSKLDQWEIIFEHSDKLGMFLHFKTLEAENQGLLDNGAIGAYTKLYYRELVARFGHHLALNWNIGEEIGDWVPNHITPPLNTPQRLAAAEYFHQIDPYHHHVVIHNGNPFNDVLGTESKYTGVSLQTNKPDFSRVHSQTLRWIDLSKKAGKQWALAVDEPGDAQHSLLPDAENPAHDNARKNGLWGAFMAGAWGTEWYFGYKHAHSDLTCQDFASRDLFWDQCRYVLDFFNGNNIPFWETENHDEWVAAEDYCLANPGELYIVFLKNGAGSIDLSGQTGTYQIRWFDPRNGGELQKGKVKTCKGGGTVALKGAPSEADKDWVVLIQKK